MNRFRSLIIEALYYNGSEISFGSVRQRRCFPILQLHTRRSIEKMEERMVNLSTSKSVCVMDTWPLVEEVRLSCSLDYY